MDKRNDEVIEPWDIDPADNRGERKIEPMTKLEVALFYLGQAQELLERDERPEVESWKESVESFMDQDK